MLPYIPTIANSIFVKNGSTYHVDLSILAFYASKFATIKTFAIVTDEVPEIFNRDKKQSVEGFVTYTGRHGATVVAKID